MTGLSPRRFLGLTAPLAPRVVVAAGAASSKKGRGWRRWLGPPVGGGLCRRVVFASLKGKVSPLRGDEYEDNDTGFGIVSPVLQDEVR